MLYYFTLSRLYIHILHIIYIGIGVPMYVYIFTLYHRMYICSVNRSLRVYLPTYT